MKLSKYVGKLVKVELKNGYYYVGIVQSNDINSICLIDKKNNSIDISEDMILFISEVNK